MRKVKLFLLAALLSANAIAAMAATGHEIKLTVKEFPNQDIILGYYFNSKMYVRDTVRTDAAGLAIFKDEEALPGGLYLFYLPNGKYFDVLVSDEQHFALRTDTMDLVGNLSISGARESELFLGYQQFIDKQHKNYDRIQKELASAGNDEEAKAKLRAEAEALGNEVADYMNREIAQYPGTFYAKFLKGLQDPDIPDFEVAEGTANPDSVIQAMTYHYYKEHFFDNIDLQDERFLRTPYFAQKLETFIDKLVIQVPDSVVKEGVRLIEMARGNEEMFRFLVQFMFNRANESKIMGMDAAMVAFAEKYYLSGEATWADQEFLDKLETRVREIKPTLIGNKAHEMRMESIEGQIYSLNELNAEITIVAFFEPSCGHCKKEIPKLYREVFEPYRSKGVQVFAVYTLADREEWTNFINEHELYDWINVYDPYHQTHFRDYYDIKSTPTIFILDREKKIIAKKLDVDQMPGFLDYVLSNK